MGDVQVANENLDFSYLNLTGISKFKCKKMKRILVLGVKRPPIVQMAYQ